MYKKNKINVSLIICLPEITLWLMGEKWPTFALKVAELRVVNRPLTV